jgi:redox-sensitive bicupin YhaK (pirin superfamily)
MAEILRFFIDLLNAILTAMETSLRERQQIRTAASPRAIALRTFGHRHGPITRIVSPSDIGEAIKPFVFLDRGEVRYTGKPLFGIHPHSGIATLTVVLDGAMRYEDTTGKQGTISAGGLEWMKAGGGVWHDGGALPGDPLRVFQLWVALQGDDELGPAESHYIAPEKVQQEGPVRVVLGEYGPARSVIPGAPRINYFHVRLKAGERWHYTPPADHDVAWLAVDRGGLRAADPIGEGELVVFEPSTAAIDLEANGDTSFVFGSAPKHPHPLVLGYYSVHTSAQALARGEAGIARIGEELRKQGRL